jgi:hypothetical protein
MSARALRCFYVVRVREFPLQGVPKRTIRTALETNAVVIDDGAADPAPIVAIGSDKVLDHFSRAAGEEYNTYNFSMSLTSRR